MITLEKIHLVQFFLFDKQSLNLTEVSGIFGPNGSGKSSFLDAVQIALLGANMNNTLFNAQADEKSTSRSLKSYCLGQYGDSPEDRARENAQTYITLIWKNTETQEVTSTGVCIRAEGNRDKHEVLGRYIAPGIELTLEDHLHLTDGESHPRQWELFKLDVINRTKLPVDEVFYQTAERYVNALLSALRGSLGLINPKSFIRAFKFGIGMKYGKSVDEIIRYDVIDEAPTDIKKFKEVSESFRDLNITLQAAVKKVEDATEVKAIFDQSVKIARNELSWDYLDKDLEVKRWQALRDNTESKLVKAKEELVALTVEKDDKKQKSDELAAMLEACTTKIMANTAYSDAALLTKEIDRSKSSVSLAERNIEAFMRSTKSKMDIMKSDSALTESASTIAELKSNLDAAYTDLIADQSKSAPLLDSLVKVAQNAQSNILTLNSAISVVGEKLKETEATLSSVSQALARIGPGKGQYLNADVVSLKKELARHGIQSVPVCDVTEIVDKSWQPVIEAFLKKRVQALLVNVEDEQKAFSIYRSSGIKGAKLARRSRIKATPTPSPSCVASLIEGTDADAVAYLRNQFLNIEKAYQDKEALAGSRTLTQDGMYVSGSEIERLMLMPLSQLRIGPFNQEEQDELKRQESKLKSEITSLKMRQDQLSHLIATIYQLSSADDLCDKFTSSLTLLLAATKELNEAEEKLNKIDTKGYELLLDEKKQLSSQINALQQTLFSLHARTGSKEEEIKNLNNELARSTDRLHDLRAMAKAAQDHPEHDPEYSAARWDEMLAKYGGDYPAMQSYCRDRIAACKRDILRLDQRADNKVAEFCLNHKEQLTEEIRSSRPLTLKWFQDFLVEHGEADLNAFKLKTEEAFKASQEIFRNDVVIAINNNLALLDRQIKLLNNTLAASPTFTNGERYRFKKTLRPSYQNLYRFIKEVEKHGADGDLFGTPGSIPEEFRTLLENSLSANVLDAKSPLNDYREFFEFDIEILRFNEKENEFTPKGLLSKRIGTGSGGEHRAPLYVIAGAALASAYRIDSKKCDGMRLMLIDEAFVKMDMENMIASIRYLKELGLQVFMASPGENLPVLTPFMGNYFSILKDPVKNIINVECQWLSEAVRQTMSNDIPALNPELLNLALAAVQKESTEELADHES